MAETTTAVGTEEVTVTVTAQGDESNEQTNAASHTAIKEDAQSTVEEGASKAATESAEPADEEPAAEEPAAEEPAAEEPVFDSLKADGMNATITYEWLRDMANKVSDVTSRITTLETTQTQNNDAADDEENQGANPMSGVKTGVRDCNWEQFKNRYSPDECNYAIETLLAGEDLDGDMEKEQFRRVPRDKRLDYAYKKPRRRKGDRKPHPDRIERVRINSVAILKFLEKITGEKTWSSKPLTFLRPFRILIHFHDKMEEEFAKMQQRAEGDSGGHDQPAQSSGDTSEVKQEDAASTTEPTTQPAEGEDAAASTEGANADEQPAVSTETPAPAASSGVVPATDDGYEEIKTYMEFARSRLLPVHNAFAKMDYNDRPKVRFPELWSLFRPGEIVVRPSTSKTKLAKAPAEGTLSAMQRAEEPTLWKVLQIGSFTPAWKITDKSNTNDDDDDSDGESDSDGLTIWAFYIDFDGVSYSAVTRQFLIRTFETEKDVTKLVLYPLRFHSDGEQLMARRSERGARFRSLMAQRYLPLEYDGWSLEHDPFGESIFALSNYDEAERSARHITSDVIIDFQEAYQAKRDWKPDAARYIKSTFGPTTEFDKFAIVEWSDENRAKALKRITEAVITQDDVTTLDGNVVLDTDDFIVDADVRETERDYTKQKFSYEDLALLPARLMAYALKDRKFFNADIQYLKVPTPMTDPYNELKIPHDHKRLLKAIVQDHFDKKVVHRTLQDKGQVTVQQDFIRGKGKGLVILLHGAPGVGKTATAEAVAFAHRKPLFAITCGDIGVHFSDLEYNLSEIFRLANLWDCVLLLDEAEIFLSRREKVESALKTNAVVSIFLRTLEYYPGILFLTTNRPGVLDEAINSRIHFSIHFPYLDYAQTLALFDMNLERAKIIAAQRAEATGKPPLHMNVDEIRGFAIDALQLRAGGSSGGSSWWNGRQIRNAFQLASSLAYADLDNDNDPSNKYLGRKHFQYVQSLFEDYEKYRETLFHKTDNELAEGREERADQHVTPARRDHRAYGTGAASYQAPRGHSPQPHRGTSPRPHMPYSTPPSFQSSRSMPVVPSQDRPGGLDYPPQDSGLLPSHNRQSSYSPMTGGSMGREPPEQQQMRGGEFSRRAYADDYSYHRGPGGM